MGITNAGTWCQACVSTNALGIRTATSILRRLGYVVHTSSLGRQVTDLGVIKMTLINVRVGSNPDTRTVSQVLWTHIPELRR